MKQILIILFICAFTYVSMLACKCIPEKTIKDEIYLHDVVMVGTIIKRTPVIYPLEDISGYSNFPTMYGHMEYTIKVETVYKGRRITRETTLITGSGGDCGYMFQIGRKYIIYAHYATTGRFSKTPIVPFLVTSICTRTKLYNETEIKGIQKIEKKKPII